MDYLSKLFYLIKQFVDDTNQFGGSVSSNYNAPNRNSSVDICIKKKKKIELKQTNLNDEETKKINFFKKTINFQDQSLSTFNPRKSASLIVLPSIDKNN